MHIDVHQLGVDADVKHRDRMTPPLEPALVALFQREHESARHDRPAVDGQDYPVPSATAHTRLRHQPGHQRQADDLQHLRRDRGAVNGCAGATPVTITSTAD